jgi:Kef-type K+ transport system membrane component KefB/nucleotide-binding universal stress UspA family protein
MLTLPVHDPIIIVAIAVGAFLLAPIMMERMRLPGLVGILVAGAALGPHGARVLERSSTIVLLGTVGLLYLMFMAGAGLDLHGFRRQRGPSLAFGAASFLLPQLAGLGVMTALGYGWQTALLVGSMFGSHTLLAYPITIRLGIGKTPPVMTAVGGTLVTDGAALLVLAVVAASTRGTLDAWFWSRLALSIALYVAVVMLVLPRVARWFFRHERARGATEYLFVLLSLFVGAYLARAAGLQPIVGAFLVGLALNRLIPEHGLLSSRIHFFGDAFFVPFFLFSVGMLMDVRALAGDARSVLVMLAMTATVLGGKAVAAMLAGRLSGAGSDERWLMAGLTMPQAAATLAAALVGREVGLIDDTVLNGVFLMMLVTVIVGPLLVERFGRRVALRDSQSPAESGQPNRILIPMANPASATVLMDLALAIREPQSEEPLLPLTVVPPDDETGPVPSVALAERMLAHAVAYAGAAGAPVTPLTRVDNNFAAGIARGIAETRASMLVVGWDGRRYATGGIFGSVLDQLLEVTHQQVLVAKLGHPLNTTDRLVVLVPAATEHVPGFDSATRTLKLLASRLSASVHALVVSADPQPVLDALRNQRPAAPVTVEHVPDWDTALARLPGQLRRDDLVVVLSSRRGAVSWLPVLDRMPGILAMLVPESFVLLYLAEGGATVADSLVAEGQLSAVTTSIKRSP